MASPGEQDDGPVPEITHEGPASVEPAADDTAAHWRLDDITDEQAEEPVTETPKIFQTYDSVTEEFFNHATIEQTASHLLNIALYLDDLQDGVRPSEILDPLLETVSKVKESFSATQMLQPHAILANIENRLNLIEPSKERLSVGEIDELRSLLNTLRVYYPEELFPLSEDGVIPVSSDVTAEPKADVSPFVRELSTIPGLDLAIAGAIEKAGFFSREELSGATLAALLNIPGITPSIAEAVFRYTGAAPGSSKSQPAQRKSSDTSMLADVDDDLLREFEQVLDDAFAPKQQVELRSLHGGRAADLLQEVGVVGEDGDREIIEIFLGYGYEILDKLRSVVAKIARRAVTANDMLLCADWIKSIRSSSGYMDYRKLESFLDDWYEKTLWAADHLDSLSDKDILFMQENLAKFQDFLHGMERVVNPEIEAPKTTFASAQELAAIGSQDAAPVSTVCRPTNPSSAFLGCSRDKSSNAQRTAEEGSGATHGSYDASSDGRARTAGCFSRAKRSDIRICGVSGNALGKECARESRCQDNACRFDESGHPSQPGGRISGEPVLRRTLVAESERFSPTFDHSWSSGQAGR